jgi:HAMP domain-containing protein
MQTKGIAALRLIAVTVVLLNFSSVGSTQNKGSLPVGQMPNAQNPLPSLGPNLTPEQEEKQSKLRNDDRQKRLEADTDKLLQLATQLHEDVAKTNKNVLSIDVIKRADEIERLAHAVKERMRG